jgi:predicted flap endonuclease-1-like 5' DNA nuclease
MFPDEDPDGPGGLEADTDDDGDGHLDTFENDCGSDSLNATSIPLDMDGDEICDGLDEDIDGDGIFNILETNTGVYNSTTDTGTDPLNPDTDGDGICDGPSAPANGGCVAGADDFPFDPSASKDTDGDGMPDTLTGTSTSVPPLVEDLDDDDDGVDDELESDCDTNPLDAESVPTLNDDGNCKDSASSGGDSDGGFGYMWCIPCLLILLLLLLVPLLIGRDRVLGMLLVGPEPENTISEPEFVGGAGTQEDPFILAPAEGVKPGESVNSTEVITIDKMSRIDVDMMDFNQEINGDRFSMFETNINEVGTRIISVGDDGEITINMLFDDGVGEPTYEGGEFTGLLKLGRASVYLSWTVTVEPDKKKLKEIEKQRKADEKAAKKAEEAEAKRMAKEEAEAKKKAEEEAAAAAKEAEEEEAAAAAALLAKEEEETEAKKKAEEEAAAAAKEAEEEEAAAALLVKKEEEAAAKKKAKEAEEKAAAKKKADEEKAKKAEETAAAALLVKKAEEAAAKKKAKEEADAKKAKEAEEKAAAKKKADEEKAKKAEEAAAAAAAAKPVTKEAKKKEELKRVKANASKIDFKVLGTAKASEKDDLQVIKGIGPFIEEKLNALGIYTYRQISKMNSKLEDSVNLAIEFFPGRVKRDQWVAQAKILLGEDVKIDEKALKKAEELERVAKKAEKIDFGTIGVASASDKDNLQELKGIGPFIEEKLNALGIFKFVQIAKMTSKIEDEVNIAIEFFPGRVKRDEWVKQAKERTK